MHDLKFILICFSNSFVIWFKFKINDWNLYWNKVLALTLYLFLSVQLARLYIIEQLFKLRRKYCSQQKNISLVLERFHRRSQYRLIPRHKNSLLNEKCKTVLNNCTRYAHICNVFTRYQHKKMRISYILCCSSLQKSIQDLHKFRRSPSHLEQIGIWMTPSVNGVMSFLLLRVNETQLYNPSSLLNSFHIDYWANHRSKTNTTRHRCASTCLQSAYQATRLCYLSNG